MSVSRSKLQDGEIPTSKISPQQSLINEEAVAKRRNPLPTAAQKAKQRELAKYSNPDKIPNQVYGLFVGDGSDEVCIYIGVSVNPANRWKEHYAAAKLGADQKECYVIWRELGLDAVRMVVLDPSGQSTEREWYEAYTAAGHPLTNVAATMDNKRLITKPAPKETKHSVESVGAAFMRKRAEKKTPAAIQGLWKRKS